MSTDPGPHSSDLVALATGLLGYPETAQCNGENVREVVDPTIHPCVPFVLDVIEHICKQELNDALISAKDAAETVDPAVSVNWYFLTVLANVRALGKLGRHREAIDMVLEREHLIPEVDPFLSLVLHWQLGFEYRRNGDLAESFRYTYAARMEALRISAERELATITSDLGNLHLESGDAVKALARYEEAVHLTRVLGEEQMVDMRLANVATALQRLSRDAEAAEIYRSILLRNDRTFSPNMRLGVLANLAIAQKRQGKYEEAEVLYQEMLPLIEQMPSSSRSVHALSGQANLFVLTGRHSDALEVLNRARSIALELDAPHWVHEVDSQRADVLHSLGNEEESLELLRSSFSTMKDSSFTRITLEIGVALEERLRDRGQFQDAYDVIRFCSELREKIYQAESERAVELGQVRIAIESERKSMRAQEEQRRQLLHEVLPEKIANRLMNGESRIADHLDLVGVMFADIVGFTKFAAGKPPDEVLRSLEELFRAMDEVISTHGCEKIKTIGDAYMATSSVHADHAVESIVSLARCGMDFLDVIRDQDHQHMNLRIGLHAGPVVAGVMSGKRIAYDMWGDTVNIASRMESSSTDGHLQTTKVVADILTAHKDFAVVPRTIMEVRGRGQMETFWVTRAT